MSHGQSTRHKRRSDRFRQGGAVERKIPDERRETVWCDACGKRSWQNRKAARRAARVTPRGESGVRLQIYSCPRDPDVFHVGHAGPGVPRAYYRAKAEQA